MAFNGSGVYQLVMDWVADAQAGIKIRADRHMTQDTDFANALSNTLTKDGQSLPSANIPLNGKRLINVGDPINPQDAVTQKWVGDNVIGGALIADAPPAAGKVGNLWWDSDSGNLFLRFDDGSSVQWVQVNIAPPDSTVFTTVNSPAVLGVSNGSFKLYNGVIVNFGVVGANANGDQTAVFATPFPNAYVSASVIVDTGTSPNPGNTTHVATIFNISNTQMSINARYVSAGTVGGAAGSPLRWIAIGY